MPIDSSAWKKVGKIKEPHGLKGDLYVLAFAKQADWIDDLEQFILSPTDDPTQGQLMTVEKATPFKDGVKLKPKEISNRNQSDLLKGQMFFIPEELFETDEGDTIYLSEIQGFKVVDEQQVELGVISGFSSNTVQDLLVILKPNGKSAEVPFVEDFIMDLDFDGKKVQMALPEGLMDLETLQ